MKGKLFGCLVMTEHKFGIYTFKDGSTLILNGKECIVKMEFYLTECVCIMYQIVIVSGL